ncbi:ergothioneine biosynthesis protein EgtC [Actinospica sp.]|jgi:ergothioneine biosynthesis protein EgtC|uniref:ergothioneine biosynthesis protein EgtC n=1 Tax=Actinospica sp. TaxID=1872142 RepID=UPI002B607C43|nr:ergothioneine biosynthesis protein EgtC [Actinospica sp.]HWG24868.1 ergothioneine biosynthesis protein EgtC [Actinospica sp.]
MCRHLAYLGPPVSLAQLVTAPAHALYEQSWAPRLQKHGVVNADGFGIGWYPTGSAGEAEDGEEPARYRRNVPIWTDPNLPELAHAIRSHAVVAAVRSATAGTSNEESAAAPFRDGRYLFSHNGAIPDWTNLPTDLPTDLTPAELLSLQARSDSALLWLLIYRELRRGVAPEDALATVVRHVADARPTARLNLLLTDGETIFATRFGDTLWYRNDPASVLVASEPDDEFAGEWREVPDRTLLLANQAGIVRTTTLHVSYAAAEK